MKTRNSVLEHSPNPDYENLCEFFLLYPALPLRVKNARENYAKNAKF